MQGPLATVDADASVDEIVTALTGGTNAVVVADDGKPVGVVTRSDLLDYLAHALAVDERAREDRSSTPSRPSRRVCVRPARLALRRPRNGPTPTTTSP